MSDTTDVAEATITDNDDGSAVARVAVDKPLGRDREEEGDDVDTSGGGDSLSRQQRRRARRREMRDQREGRITQLEAVVGSQQRILMSMGQTFQRQTLDTLKREGETARAAYAEAERRLAEAIEKGDGASAAEAQRVMHNAQAHYTNVAAQHDTIVRQTQEPPQEQSGRVQLSRRGQQLRETFLDQYPQLEGLKDPDDQAILATIDAGVARDGHDPNSDDYWEELAERARERLPHLFNKRRSSESDMERQLGNDDNDPPPRRRGPPLGDGGRGASRGNGREVHLTADMVSNLNEAGIPLHGGDESVVRRRNKIINYWQNNPRPSAQRG